jgi:hypothetical protein
MRQQSVTADAGMQTISLSFVRKCGPAGTVFFLIRQVAKSSSRELRESPCVQIIPIPARQGADLLGHVV